MRTHETIVLRKFVTQRKLFLERVNEGELTCAVASVRCGQLIFHSNVYDTNSLGNELITFSSSS